MSEVITPPEIPASPLPSREPDLPEESPGGLSDGPRSRTVRGLLSAAAGWLPSIAVVCALAGLALYGHHNDWKLPKFGSLAEPSTVETVAWCDSHGVPEDECINCIPDLIEPAPELTFCHVHGVHGCVLDDPSLAETKKPVQATPADLERAERALAIRPRRENLPTSQFPGSRIQFASIDAMRRAGVDVEPVTRRAMTESLNVAAEVLYDATRTAEVSPPADGVVRQVFVNVGDWVEAGQLLAVVDSEKAGRLKSELLAALSDERLKKDVVRRIEPLAQQDAVPRRRLIETQTDLQQARAAVDRAVRALSNLGLTVDVDYLRSLAADEANRAVSRLGTEQMDESSVSGNLIGVTAPLSGRVVVREAVIGEVVDRGTRMFRLSDTRVMWLDLRVPAEDAMLTHIGQEVRFQPDGQTRQHEGHVIWISSAVDRQTRTVRVRAELDNSDGHLKNEAFGIGEIILREEPDAIVVPDEAVQWDGENTLVFVRDARFFEEDRPKFFVARSVRTGVKQDGFTEIIAGVLPGEVVASRGSDVLRAQLLKNNLGAGCTCGH